MNGNLLLMEVCEFILAPTSKEAIAAKCRMEKLMKQLKAELPTTDDVERTVHRVLNLVGAPTKVMGYRYLVEAICITVRKIEATGMMTKYLYPAIADMFGTTAHRVERDIRRCIERAFDNIENEVKLEYFGSTVDLKSGKVTNREFISKMALVIRNQLGM